MLRIATEADVPEILNIYGPYVLTSTATFEYTVPSREEFGDRFRRITARFPWLVYEEAGEILGYAYGSRAFERAAYGWDADLSIYLRQGCSGRGIGRALYETLEHRLAAQGYYVLYGLVTSANAGSCAFHEAMGYRAAMRLPSCGFKFGQWYDIIWYEKRLRDGNPAQSPISWAQASLL